MHSARFQSKILSLMLVTMLLTVLLVLLLLVVPLLTNLIFLLSLFLLCLYQKPLACFWLSPVIFLLRFCFTSST